MKKLLINADDFGFDEDTFHTTSDLLEKGIIQSTTIMTNMPFSDKAIKYAACNINKYEFGLHFNIAEGFPHHLNRKNSLLSKTQEFNQPIKQRLRLLLGLFRAEDVANELDEQLSFLFDNGVKVSHVDSHGHLHKFPQVIESMRPILKKYSIRKVRRPQNIYINQKKHQKFLNSYCSRSFKTLLTPDYFVGTGNSANVNWFSQLLTDLPEGITELGIHPGKQEKWRSFETTPFLKEDFFALLDANNIKLTSFGNLS